MVHFMSGEYDVKRDDRKICLVIEIRSYRNECFHGLHVT